MELIIISASKLKIMLTPPDMQYYELPAEPISCIDDQTRRAFRHIFDDAKSQVGFETEGEKLFVQLYASRDGGCEIFVSKLGEEPATESFAPTSTPVERSSACEDSCLTPAEQELLRRVLEEHDDPPSPINDDMDTSINSVNALSTPSRQLHKVIVSLTDMASLLGLCRRLLSLGYDQDSYVYIEIDTATTMYHLFLDVPDGGFYLLPESYAFLKEYGQVRESGQTELYLSEHGKLLCPCNAVGVLGAL